MGHIDVEPDAHGSLDAFVRAEGTALIRFAFLLTAGDAAAAEDLVQAVLARMAERGIDDLEDPRAYIWKSVVNEHRSTGRRLLARHRAASRLPAAPADTGSTTGPEDRDALLTALRTLSERERAVVVLRFYEDLPDTEIAAALGCARASVRSLCARAMAKLRVQLEPTYHPALAARLPEEGDRR